MCHIYQLFFVIYSNHVVFQNLDHESALHSAAQYGHAEIVQVLLEVSSLINFMY